MTENKCAKILLAAFAAICPAFFAVAETVRVADCVRDPALDYWAQTDVKYCTVLMDAVLAAAGVEKQAVPFGEDGLIDADSADVICSVFRNDRLDANYTYSLQPIGQMHYALYAAPARAAEMISTKITDWPRLNVGYSPVSQGDCYDYVKYFQNAGLSPKFVEYATSAGAVEALIAGEIDVLFLYTPAGLRPEGVREIVPIGDKPMYFAVSKDKPELAQALNKAYRDFYIDNIDVIDNMRERLLGIPKPKKRVRVAAYQRGEIFSVAPDGTRSGQLNNWLKTICRHTRWTLDFVYGGYDESLEDVRTGRLDIVGGIGFSSDRRKNYLFPHTPIGIIRAYLWVKPDSGYKPNVPESWRGMKVALLSKTVSAERAKRQLKPELTGITFVEYANDKAMLEAYFNGEVDACVDIEQPALADHVALHMFLAHPVYICASPKRPDLFDELEAAFEDICDDFPKYQRMIAEQRYGHHNNMAALSLEEADWLARRMQSDKPVVIDFSPWPYPIFGDDGKPTGFIGKFLDELSNRIGLKFIPAEQNGVQTAEAKFMRGDTDLWVPYPANSETVAYGNISVFSIPVPLSAATKLGAEDMSQDFELFAKNRVPRELVSILNKVVADIDPSRLQELFMLALAEATVVHRVFGLTGDELLNIGKAVAVVILVLIAVFGTVMGILLKRETNRANAAAAESEEHARAKTRFLAMMSHELRTPLNAVIGFAEFIGRPGITAEQRKEYVSGILLSSHALLELVNDVLDLSKLEAGAMHMKTGVCEMAQILREIPAIFDYRVRQNGVKLVVDAPHIDEMPLVSLSQQGMRQIMINLVGNSSKFTTSGEIRIKVRWTPESRNLHIEVSDTGCGISDEKLAKLFNPFVQDIASRMKASSGDMKGTGLGLPIVKMMIDAAGGTISAESELGKGTRFIIDLPDLGIAEEAPANKRSAGNDLKFESLPERVLVVDDMAMNRKILSIHLNNLKIKDVRFAENGLKALDEMKEWLPDVVLTDMWMPDMDGASLAEAMKKDARLAGIPIVAVTADVDVGSKYDLGLFAKVLSKPITGDKLKALFGVG